MGIEYICNDVDTTTDYLSDIDPVDDYPLEESDTVWQDDIKSMVRAGDFRITQKVNAKRLEYIDDLASAYPVRIGTVFVVDLHNPKHHIINETKKELYTVDHMIRNAVRAIL
jgi:hypothetical protein